MSMMRKKIDLHLQPIKINKTQANYQALLLNMMSKFVAEQKQSNRLLRKLAGEHCSDERSNFSINSNNSRSIQQSQKGNTVNFSSEYTEEESFNHISRISLKKPVQVKPTDKNQVETVEKQDYSEKIVQSVQNLGKIMERIEQKLDTKLTMLIQTQKSCKYIKEPEDKTHHRKGMAKHREKQNQEKLQKQINININQKSIAPINQNNEDNFIRDGFNLAVVNNKEKNLKGDKKKKIKGKNGRLSLFDAFIIQNLLQERLQKKPVLSLNAEIQQKKNYAILNQIGQILPYCDKRQIKVKILLEDIMEYYQVKSFTNEGEVNLATKHWLGNVYRSTASVCWNLLSNNQLSLDQTKILFSENIIYNFIVFMQKIKTLNNGSYRIDRSKLAQEINNSSMEVLEFLCKQYPQTKVEDPNIAIRKSILSINNEGEAEFDLISKISQAKEASFKIKENADYTQQIMKTINFMIERSNQQYQPFKDMFNDLFKEIFLPISKRRQVNNEENEAQDHQDQLYSEQVKSYTKCVIGRKINKNTPKYSQQEIQNGIFFVKSPSILRVITKWVQQLDQLIRNPQKQIKNTQSQFKDHDGLPMYLYAQIKNGLYKYIKDKQQQFENKIKHIKDQCYNMEVLLTLQAFTADSNQIHLNRQQISVGKYCNYLKSAISSYICSELNEVIHFLLTVPTKVDETKIGIVDPFYQEQSKKDLINLNLINFKIFDLLRCKCISKEVQILYLIRRINEKNGDLTDPFKIIRVKDRLSHGTRDILINAQIGKGIICQIQLAVATNIDKKQELLDQYNHFLYQLKRAKLGPLSENASIWSTLQQRSSFFENLIEKEQRQVKHGEIPHPCVSRVQTCQTLNIKKFSRPIICLSCHKFYEIPRTCLLNISCLRCRKTYCGECHLVHMGTNQKKQYLFQKYFRPFFPYMTQYSNYDKQLPMFGFLIRKYYLKRQICFFKIICKNNNENLQQKQKIQIQLIISVIQNQKITNRSINTIVLQAERRNNGLYLKDKRFKKELNNYIIYSIDTTKELEKKTQSYQKIFQNFSKEKLRYINLVRQPIYIEELKIIKKSKQIKKQTALIQEVFKNEDQALLTYLKLDKTVILVQIEVQQKKLLSDLVKKMNINKLKSYAVDKTFAVSMDFRQMTNEMMLIADSKYGYFTEDLYKSFSQRITKLYLNFGMINEVTFLQKLTKIKFLYLSSNKIISIQGVQYLINLEYICFDKNQVSSLQPLANLVNLTQVSGSENQIISLSGIDNLTKLKILTLYKNKIPKIEFTQNLRLKQLSLNNNQIKQIENLSHMKESIDQLYIGQNYIINVEPIYIFSGLKKLSLDGLNIAKIDPMFIKNFQSITNLSLADNLLERIQHFQGDNIDLIELNLKNNRLTELSGLQFCSKLQILKVQHNLISNIVGIKGNEHLRILYIEQNPLQDCSDLYYFENNIEVYYSKQEDNVAEPHNPKPSFYSKFQAYQKHRGASSSGSNEDSEVEET